MPNLNPVGPPHNIGGVFHTQIMRDPATSDPTKAFYAQIDGPVGFQQQLLINNGVSKDYPIAGVPGAATLHVEIDNYTLLPAGSSPNDAKGISFLVVFKLREIFLITVGSVPVTATL